MRISDGSSDVCSSDLRRAWPAQTRHLRQIALAGLRTWCLWACEHDPTIASTYPTLLPDRTKSLFRRRPACNPGLVSKRAMTRVSELAREGSQMPFRSEEHTSELQSLMRISYAVFCLKKKQKRYNNTTHQLTKQTTT